MHQILWKSTSIKENSVLDKYLSLTAKHFSGAKMPWWQKGQCYRHYMNNRIFVNKLFAVQMPSHVKDGKTQIYEINIRLMCRRTFLHITGYWFFACFQHIHKTFSNNFESRQFTCDSCFMHSSTYTTENFHTTQAWKFTIWR